MKKYLMSFICMCLFFCSCGEKRAVSDIDIPADAIVEDEKVMEKSEPPVKLNEVYVNATDGLVLRTEPDSSSDKIRTLEHKEKVELISKEFETVEIAGIESQWCKVHTEDDYTGYVFGGFLEKELSVIDYISKLEGKFVLTESKDKDFFEIKNAGDGKVSVTTNLKMFSAEYSRIVKVDEIKNKDGVLMEVCAEGGFTSSLIRVSYKPKTDTVELYWKYDKATVDDDLNIIDERHEEKTDVYKREQ